MGKNLQMHFGALPIRSVRQMFSPPETGLLAASEGNCGSERDGRAEIATLLESGDVLESAKAISAHFTAEPKLANFPLKHKAKIQGF